MHETCINLETTELQNTTIVNSSSYDAQGLCQGFQARRSIYEDIAIEASLQCRTDFEQAVGGLKLDDSVTYENPNHGHSVSNLMPLTLPERVELLGYTSEYLCLHDDEADAANANGDVVINDRKCIQKQLLMKLLGRFMAVNRKQGQAIMDAFIAYGIMAASLNKEQHFQTIEQYMDYRFHDFGSEFFLATTLFGMDFDPLTVEERAIAEPFVQTGYRHISLLNDLFSFDVEWEDTFDKDQLVNGVCVFIRSGVSPSEAKERVKVVLRSLEQDYMQHIYTATSQGLLSLRLQKFVTAVAQQMVGNLVWSSSCLRYNLAYRLANRANRKRTDSHVDFLAPISTIHRKRSDSVLNQSSKDVDTVIITTAEIAIVAAL